MWFLILQDIHGEREVWFDTFYSFVEAEKAIECAVLSRPNTARAFIVEVGAELKIKLHVEVSNVNHL